MVVVVVIVGEEKDRAVCDLGMHKRVTVDKYTRSLERGDVGLGCYRWWWWLLWRGKR